VVGDELYFYVSGRTGVPGTNKAGTLTTGIGDAAPRRVRLDGRGRSGRHADDAPVRFTGKHLFVNVDDPNGELRVEILNQAGQVVPRFTAENCVPMTANKTLHAVRWKGVDDLSSWRTSQSSFAFT
jgi:hypothetical protein